MTTHVHILGTPAQGDSISRLMQYVGRYYVSHINRGYGRTGSLSEGRHKGSLIDSVEYLLTCQRYIELNPIRAGMVETPGEYPWSSYRANTFGEDNILLTPHELYRAGSGPIGSTGRLPRVVQCEPESRAGSRHPGRVPDLNTPRE